MIGKIYTSLTPFYDLRNHRNSFKKRPVLIIGGPRNHDYTVLPISTVSRKENLDSEYDIELVPADYPELKLNKVSYVRVHKQTVIHEASLYKEVSDMKEKYEEKYLEIIQKLEEFNSAIINDAL
ncbi:PemK-like protein [Blautia hydrogenotrophica]|uniref:type II toxin-antitoxin system PemK/MazF family toxin n=1 Tax=Blautia hydrogenotrophica TaxID=53443 RepID=UPI0006BF651E|nr:type II toxin-antitoxin system PemK/MazF family toxin [Blautia hydrogenotrophica]CUN17192.1 PemK-like protein [Blautia hydrogenotrophica]SCI23720.1 PemK-like protein [uncultured Blautia sp.]